ncbi:hypothetical protein RQP54_18975 [Curvibacter sp. APW13]|uniref:hypothetical protein n=1 Tax=Curvibacter sp. APW13 TaxID=3077236 RepID=UPI0028DFD083|nr:hypothetical protein [Curvibacter sp. APW13]MDT8992964.1 hypothetical protein [Curvibacter sp. APW13]
MRPIVRTSDRCILVGMFEHRTKPLLHPHLFAWRVLRHLGIALLMLGVSLAIGMAGYMVFEALPLVDAFLNAAMLLGGMGPVHLPKTDAGKVFAGSYALYAGLIFLVSVAVFLSPLVHRAFHQFHLEGKD